MTLLSGTLLSGARLILPDRIVERGWIEIVDGRIARLGAGDPSAASAGTDLGGRWVLPGLVDIHCHGGDGASYTDADADAARRVAAFHRRHGTTTTLASLVTASTDKLIAAIEALVPLCQDDTLAGIHLEGPFLAEARRGAHDPSLLRAPTPALLSELMTAGQGYLRQVTIAPELPGALAAIRQLTEVGVVAAAGHTDGSYAQMSAAFDAGATIATHLFNGMKPVHHRDPGPVAASLAAAGVICEAIGDGVHLAPDTVAMLFAVIGADRIALITDAMAAAGVGDGSYQLGPLAVRVSNGIARLDDGTDSGSIAGGTATLADVWRQTIQVAGVDIVAATRAATLTPARAVGLEDHVGSIAPGRRADLLVCDESLAFDDIMWRGSWLSEQS